MDTRVVSELYFERFTYAQKDNEITFSVQLVSYQNSFKINENHQNNILTLATGNDDIIISVTTMITLATDNDNVSNVHGYCSWLLCYRCFSITTLSKDGIDQLKN
jgi:hypothetical protein